MGNSHDEPEPPLPEQGGGAISEPRPRITELGTQRLHCPAPAQLQDVLNSLKRRQVLHLKPVILLHKCYSFNKLLNYPT